MFYSKTARKWKPKIWRSCVPNLRLISQKMSFQWDFVLGVLPSFSTRWPSNPISDHIRASPLPYMLWVIWNMFFHTFLNIYDVDITFRSIKGSMAVFDFNSTSKKLIKDMQQEPWMYVIVHAASKIENLLFFLYIRNTFRPFFLKK